MLDLTPELLGKYLTSSLPGARDVRVSGMSRLPLGASRETYRFDALVHNVDGSQETLQLILRRDPPASHVESDRRTEFESYRAIHGHGIPVPRMILLETDPAKLGGAISIAEDLRGFHNSEYQLQQPEWSRHLPGLSEQMWGYMGKLAAVDVAGLNLETFMKPATIENAARRQLDHWVDTFRRNQVGADPIMEAAIRLLNRTCPVARKLAMVHGDFRAGNFLYDDDGRIRAILDWEMAHIGDPLEDLAWSLNRVFCFGKDDRRSGLALRDQAIAIWERSSGMAADPRSLAWYELFACLKGQALWVSTATVWESGKNRDIILAYASWWLTNAQNRAALEVMERL
jgi:aminoglycoside phosphotransferase (APT) family kinase protein